MMSASSRRAQAAERNVRLDPQGIYGTRSARRQNQLRRRRQMQNALLWLVGALAVGFFVWWLFQPRQSARGANWTRQLPFRPASPPLTAPRQNSQGGAALLFTSQSGGLWRWNAAPTKATASAPRRIFSTAFAPSATPLVSKKQVFWPGGDGILRALDAGGVQKWRGVLGSALVCTPALISAGNREIVAAGDDEGQIAAFDADSGKPLWKTELGGAAGAALGVVKGDLASPELFVSPGGAKTQASRDAGAAFLVPLLSSANSRGGLVCLDARSGKVKWRFPGDARSQSAGLAAPVALGNRVFWCNDEGAAVCLDARTGQKIWKSFAAPTDGKPPLETRGALVSLRGGAAIVATASVVAFGGNDGFLRGFDLTTGALRWSQNLGGSVRFPAQIAIFEGKPLFLAAGEAPAIFLLDAATGRIERRWTVPYPVSYGLCEANGAVFALDASGHLQVASLK